MEFFTKGESMEDLKPYPPYKNAIKNILEGVKRNGYGILYEHQTLKDWMDIKDPTTIEEYKKTEFDYLSSLDKLKGELLCDHNIFLTSDIGKGYRVLHPDEQVGNGVDKHVRKAQRQLVQAARVLTYVNDQLLSIEGGQARMRKMERLAFLKSAFSKKKIPKPKTLSKICN